MMSVFATYQRRRGGRLRLRAGACITGEIIAVGGGYLSGVIYWPD